MNTLQITDGTTTIDLLDATNGYLLSSWQPQVADYKDGGVWQDSKISEGRRPVMGVYANVVETMNLWIGGASQDAVALLKHNLQTLLDNAFSYFQPGSPQSSPIYLVAKADSETNPRYAMIFKGNVTGFNDVYFKEFATGLVHGGLSKVSGFANLTLTIERGHWLSHAPGDTVQINTVASVDTTNWNWVINTALPTNITSSIIQLASGDLLTLGIDGQVLDGASDATTWSQLIASGSLRNILFQAANGDVYAGGMINKSTNDGASFSVNYSTGVTEIRHIMQTSSGALIASGKGTTAGGAEIWRSTDNGSSWSSVMSAASAVTNRIHHVAEDSSFNLWAVGQLGTSNTAIWMSDDDGATWTNVFTFEDNDVITWIGELSDGNLYFTSSFNKDTVSSLWWSTDGGTTWTRKSNIGVVYANNLIELSDNTLLIVGSTVSSSKKIIATSIDFGFSWSRFNWSVSAPSGASNRQGVLQLGDNSVIASDNTNLIQGTTSTVTTTGEGLINGFADNGQTSFPFVEIAAENVTGDIPALIRLLIAAATNHSNRIIVGLRNFNRGSLFTPYLNIADDNNFTGINVSDETTAASFVTNTNATAGIYGVFNPFDATPITTQFIVSIGPSIVSQFYGTYRCFVRCYMPTGTIGDIGIRLQISSGSGGITLTTDTRYPATNLDFEVLDFGQVTLPASGVFKSDDIADTTEIRIQCSSVSGTPTVGIYDIILIPTDEWVGDFVDRANEDDSDVGFSNSVPKYLDVDSATDPRNPVKALVRRVDNSYITSKYRAISNKAILQANSQQRLWFFFMQTSATGTSSYVWLAPASIEAGISVYAVMRYLLLRGNQ